MATKLTPEFLLEVVTKKHTGNVRGDVLKKTTHINLEERGIEKIEALEGCEHLRVLYLFDNSIQRIENLGFGTTLTHLYLQNNLITAIEGLDTCTSLSKLYLVRRDALFAASRGPPPPPLASRAGPGPPLSTLLRAQDGNQIGCVEGLHNLPRLEELSISRQVRAHAASSTWIQNPQWSIIRQTACHERASPIRLTHAQHARNPCTHSLPGRTGAPRRSLLAYSCSRDSPQRLQL